MENRLIDFIGKIRRSRSLEDCIGIYLAEMAQLGFVDGMFANVIEHDSLNNEAPSFIVHSTYSAAFEADYEAADGALHDESVIWCKNASLDWAPEKTEYMYWVDDIDPKIRRPEVVLIDEISFSHGIRRGLSIPLYRKADDMYAGVGLSATHISDKEFTQDVMPEIEYVLLATNYFDLYAHSRFSLTSLLSNGHMYSANFNDQDVLAMQLIYEGKKIKELAGLLGFISKYQPYDDRARGKVDRYIKKLCKKAKAKNRHQLIDIYEKVIL